MLFRLSLVDHSAVAITGNCWANGAAASSITPSDIHLPFLSLHDMAPGKPCVFRISIPFIDLPWLGDRYPRSRRGRPSMNIGLSTLFYRLASMGLE
jgi:hypothetical protein